MINMENRDEILKFQEAYNYWITDKLDDTTFSVLIYSFIDQTKALTDEIDKLQSRISELENGNEMVNYILEIDYLTTAEFCDKYNVPRPIFTGQVESSVNELLRIDAVKHKMFVQKAKEIFKNRK